MSPAIQKQVPILRFKDERGKEYPDWEERRLRELYDITSSKRVFQSEWKDSGIPFYRAREIIELSKNGNVDNALFISPEMYKEYSEKYGAPQEGDLLVTGVGTIGKLYVVPMNSKFYFKDGNIVWFKSLNQVSSIFVRYLFGTRYVEKQLGDNASITTVATYTIEAARNTRVLIPVVEEQQKIADFLSSVDTKIEQLNQKKALWEEYKKGMMQQLFPQPGETVPKLRFSEFRDAGEWESKILGTQGNFLSSLTGKTAKDFDTGDAAFIPYMNVFSNTFTNITDLRSVNVADSESQSAVAKGDVFFTVSSETPEEAGMSSVLLKEIDNCYLNSFCALFRFDEEKSPNPVFLGYVLRSSPSREHLSRGAQGATRYNISRTTFRSLPILMPSSEEQQKIAIFLSAIDQKIERVDTQIKHAQAFKKGLLQQMFI